jgi:GntR family transcriptional regulator/MocR family aminotransferase
MPSQRTSSDELLLHLDPAQPLTEQVEDQIRDAVRSGRLRVGSRLPSTRALAQDLGVSRGVVGSAYAQLGAEGYLRVRQGARVEVADVEASGSVPRRPESPPRQARYNLRPDVSDYSAFPRREWLASLRTAVRDATDEELAYGDSRGSARLRDTLAEYLGRARGVVAHADRTFATVGFAHGVGAVCRVLLARGARAIAVEDPGHLSVRRIVAASGLRVVPVPVDERGLRVGELADVDAVLVTPAHHFPLTAVLAPERRAALLDWAEERDAVVLEDDVDAEFRYDRAPVGALQGLAPERVVYLGSTSRTLAPALRLGWAVVPSWLVDDLRGDVTATIIAPPAVDQLALADFVGRGELDRHLRRMRLQYRRRRDALVAALARHLPELEVAGVAAGLHVVARLPRGRSEERVLAAARGASIALAGLREHCLDAKPPAALLLGFARAPEPTLRAAVRTLAAAL